MASGAELLVAALEAAGVPVVFGLPGVHNLAAWEALRTSPIRLVGVRHEQAAAYAADGYARAGGRIGVALVTTGPGAANTLAAVGEAWASRSPVLVIATDIPTMLRRPGVHRGALHETTDQAGMFAPVTKATFRVNAAGEIPDAVRRAVETALTAPTRPVYLELPTDLLSEDVDGSVGVQAPTIGAPAEPDHRLVAQAAELLAAARRPLFWVGGGAVHSGAGSAVAALAERAGAPIVTTYQARGLVGEHPYAVGLPPQIPEVGRLWDDADVVLAVGSDLDGLMTQNWAMPQPTRLVVVNVDAADGAKNYRPDVLVTGDARTVVDALAAALPAVPDPTSAGVPAGLAALREAVWARLRTEHPAETGFLTAMARALPDDAVVLADMCIPGYWLGGFATVSAPRRLAYPLGWGTLGFAFPAALGAALCGAGPVVSVSGDGGFLFACAELATIAQERLPVTAVVVDDGGYGMLRFDQSRAGRPAYGVDLHTPDLVALAQAFGVRAEGVDGLADDFAERLADHVADPAPTVLVARAALSPPPTTSPLWYRSAAR